MTNIDSELREWAAGSLLLEAGTELLIRGGYAEQGSPWIGYDDSRKRHYVDFSNIDEHTGAMSGGQRRYLTIAASLAEEGFVYLGDTVAGLDYKHAGLVLAAIAHAAGFSDTNATVDIVDRQVVRAERPALYRWPTEASGQAASS